MRNGHSAKTLRTEVGDIRIKVPRDRAGSFEPAVVPKHSRRLAGFDDAVISLYAKGMTTGDIADRLADLYGTEVSRVLVSRVTDAVLEDMHTWQNRPLDAVYPVLLIDAIMLKVRDGQVTNRPVYVAMGITLDGHRDVLGMWVGPTGGEGAKQWMTMLTDLRNPSMVGRRRRPDRVLRRTQGPTRRDHRHPAAGDGADVCRSLVRNSLRYASKAHWSKLTADLKNVYRATTVVNAGAAFEQFANTWRGRYQAM